MKAQAFSSPIIWIQPETWKNPVPDEAGLGIWTRPRKAGPARSSHVFGTGRPRLPASIVLKHTAADQASIPNQAGSGFGSRKTGRSCSKCAGR